MVPEMIFTSFCVVTDVVKNSYGTTRFDFLDDD
jgi:hypothetical protein